MSTSVEQHVAPPPPGAADSVSATGTATARQIPTVCPGHTRPLSDIQFFRVPPAALPPPVAGAPPSDNDGEEELLLISGCHDKLPMLRSGRTGDWIGTLSGHKGAVHCATLDPASCAIAATASGDFTLRLWDAVAGSCLAIIPHGHIVKSVAISPSGRRMATGGHEGLIRVWELERVLANAVAERVSAGGPLPLEGDDVPPADVFLSHGGDGGKGKVAVNKVCWIDDDVVASGAADGTVKFWDVRRVAGGSLATISLPGGAEVRDMEIVEVQETGIITLTVAGGDAVHFYDARAAAKEGRTEPLRSVTVTPANFRNEGGASLHPVHGRTFVAGGSDLWVRVYDLESGKELDCHRGHHGPVRCVRYDPTGKTFATGSEDGTIRIWRS